MADSPLRRPAWNALNGPQAGHALGGPLARRFHPEIGPLAAAAGDDEASLMAFAALLPEEGVLATIEAWPHAIPPGAAIERRSAAVQMVAERLGTDGLLAPFDHPAIVPLGQADAADMRALAELTEPGPFATRTHELGQFWGVREEGRLIAMAGERMRVDGHGEVSAVCVHPDARGRGLGTLMTRKAAAHLAAQGLRPFLHCYADNVTAIATYERVGFRKARDMVITMVRRAELADGAS